MHRPTRTTWLILAAAFAVSAVPATAEAQGFGDRLRKRAEEAAKRKVEERTEKNTEEATDKALDKAECKIPGKKCESGEGATQSGSSSSGSSSSGSSSSSSSGGSATAAQAAALKPGEGAWRNYDFVPGDRILVAEDFTKDKVGDFPKRFTFRAGNIEIVDWQGTRYLSSNSYSAEFSIPLPKTLPERFTMEFDFSGAANYFGRIYFSDPSGDTDPDWIEIGSTRSGVYGRNIDAIAAPGGDGGRYEEVVFPFKIMADGAHVKVYMGDSRVANVPNSKLGRADRIWFDLRGLDYRAVMVGNIRIAEGGRALYDALAENGRVATQGIYFDTGSDRIRPESTPTLKEIGEMLKEHADLKLVIEGHTDNVGDASANMSLSKRRAEAVRAHLVSSFGIDASRLSATGLGQTKTVAPNTSAEGRQQNRRVELVKN